MIAWLSLATKLKGSLASPCDTKEREGKKVGAGGGEEGAGSRNQSEQDAVSSKMAKRSATRSWSESSPKIFAWCSLALKFA